MPNLQDLKDHMTVEYNIEIRVYSNHECLITFTDRDNVILDSETSDSESMIEDLDYMLGRMKESKS